MSKGLLFFCCSCCILLLTVINLSIGPIINRKLSNRTISVDGSHSTSSSSWGTLNCAILSDGYDEYKKGTVDDATKKYSYEFQINECKRKKAMHDMEYTSFIFDIVIGFVCGLLGLLHLFDLKKDFVSTTGLIGLGCGVVGFVLTFVYVIFNGIVYTNYYDSTSIYKRDGDGAFAELKGEKYECFYFDENGNSHSIIAKYSDLGKKQYNYNKDLEDSYEKEEVGTCTESPTLCDRNDGFINIKKYISNDRNKGECKYLYLTSGYITSQGVSNKDKSDRFLTTLILGLFVCLANIGLALFGFLLFRTPGDF